MTQPSNGATISPSTLDEFLAIAIKAEEHVPICLRTDLVQKHRDAEQALVDVINRGDQTLADAGDRREAAEAVQAVEAEMAEHMTDFWLREPSWERRAAVIAAHPARQDDAQDKRLGYNRTTFFPALVFACLVTVTLPGGTPEPVTGAQWNQLREALAPEQMERLANVATRLTWRQVDVPKSDLASLTLSAGEKSKQPEPSASPESD